MYSNKDYSFYKGIPKEFRHLRHNEFSEWEIPPWDIMILTDQILGKGTFGTVYKAIWRGTEVCAKVSNEDVTQEQKNNLIYEFDSMTKLHHPNIVQLLGYLQEPFTIITEFASNLDLLNYQKDNKLSITNKIDISVDILRALAYLHNRKPQYIIHRDIKPTNVVITASGKAKLTDFGISKYAKEIIQSPSIEMLNLCDDVDFTQEVGTYHYMAPELKLKETYGSKIDIYSCGILLYELFEEKRFDEISYIFEKTNENLKDIIMNMLEKNPKDRMTSLKLIKYFQNIY